MSSVTTYTTHVQVNGDSNLPAGPRTLALRSSSPVSVYANDHYVQLFPDQQVEVDTDVRGVLTLLQTVNSLGAVMYYIDADGDSLVIDPME